MTKLLENLTGMGKFHPMISPSVSSRNAVNYKQVKSLTIPVSPAPVIDVEVSFHFLANISSLPDILPAQFPNGGCINLQCLMLDISSGRSVTSGFVARCL